MYAAAALATKASYYFFDFSCFLMLLCNFLFSDRLGIREFEDWKESKRALVLSRSWWGENPGQVSSGQGFQEISPSPRKSRCCLGKKGPLSTPYPKLVLKYRISLVYFQRWVSRPTVISEALNYLYFLYVNRKASRTFREFGTHCHTQSPPLEIWQYHLLILI